jgi:ABC-2 type transport system ATP-binding protein
LGGRDRMTASIRFTLPSSVGMEDLPDALRDIAQTGADRSTVLQSRTPLTHLGTLADWALGRGLDLPDIDVRRPTLEDVSLGLTSDNEAQLP